jgi:hypothetical protein
MPKYVEGVFTFLKKHEKENLIPIITMQLVTVKKSAMEYAV